MIKTHTSRQTLLRVLNNSVSQSGAKTLGNGVVISVQNSIILPLLASHLLKTVSQAYLNQNIPGDFTTTETSPFLKMKTQLLFVIPAFGETTA